MKTVSLVIPCFNEEKVLHILHAELRRVCDAVSSHKFEFIFVDDGSRDGTLRTIKEMAAADSRVSYISFSRNFGKEAAMLAGLRASSGDYVAIIDADMQDPPSLIPEMLRTIEEEGYDSVATRRVSRTGEPPVRSFFARMFYRLINRMSGLSVMDGARDFRMMTRKMTDAVLSVGDSHRFSKGIYDWVGFSTKWLEYKNIERAAGETKWSFYKLFKYAVEGIVTFTTVPLRAATVLGLLSLLADFIYLIISAVLAAAGKAVFSAAVPVMLIIFFGGLQLLCLGVIGEYLARNYGEAKKRPVFIVRETNLKEEP